MSLKLHDNVHSLAHKRTKRIEDCFRQMRAAAAADKKRRWWCHFKWVPWDSKNALAPSLTGLNDSRLFWLKTLSGSIQHLMTLINVCWISPYFSKLSEAVGRSKACESSMERRFNFGHAS